ncbi:putative molybdopterin binding domain-containing protein [Phascolomyces articulosus]|uniref:Molybdopterin binding domain-containing protein n=1 Tax=Phascolomyces articulosus TaxID=60185 RepID=A0AAD5KEQ4_9FUNG|nr:putative molybdopterin binding domain-containing protein [Phascolomyces articulosus]
MAQEPSLTAAACIIGDEILNGKTQDTNSYYLAQFLFKLGIELKRIEVVSDDMDSIAITVRRLSNEHDIVFTSGGIGITHDDLSYAAISQAFQLELKLDNDTYERVQSMLNKRKITQRKGYERLAIFPYPAELLRPQQSFLIPVVIVNQNVYILPGIPRLFQLLVESLKPHLQQLSLKKLGKHISGFSRMDIATKKSEGAIASILTTIQARYDDLKIGSYPLMGNKDISVVISVVGKNHDAVESVAQEIAEEIDGWTYTTGSNSNNKAHL